MGKYSVFGLGYVGSTMMAGLAAQGHEAIGVDPDPEKCAAIDSGKCPVPAEDLSERFLLARKQNLLRATADAREALENSDLAFICVETASRPDGAMDLSPLMKVTREIARLLPPLSERLGIVFRSTIIPGTMEEILVPELGDHPRIAYYPEFLRRGITWEDWAHPPKIVIGAGDPWIKTALLGTFPATHAPVFWTDYRTAEMTKYIDNAFHALKITFANEIGIIAKESGVDLSDLMRIFLADRKLNLSETYLQPGFAFGGGRLGKDLQALNSFARKQDTPLPFLSSILESNRAQIRRALEIISQKAGKGPVGFVGLTFKPGTDDFRESPYLQLAADLWRSGLKVFAYDPDVSMEKLVGENLHHVKSTFPELENHLHPAPDILWKTCRLVVVGRRSSFGSEKAIRKFIAQGGYVVDLTANELLGNWCGKNYWSVV